MRNEIVRPGIDELLNSMLEKWKLLLLSRYADSRSPSTSRLSFCSERLQRGEECSASESRELTDNTDRGSEGRVETFGV